MLKEFEGPKFDETVEAHVRLGLNVRHADQQLRGTLMLPHGTGKELRVAVFAEGEKAKEAQEAGADIVGSADLAKKIEEGFTDFDVAIATPDQMGNVGKLGRILGPRGLMPNPKTGTVTMDVAKAVQESKAGKLEYRTDRGANVHLPIGKKSFDEKRCSRTTRRSSRRSSARSRRPRRAATSHDHDRDHDGPRDPRRHDAHPRDHRELSEEKNRLQLRPNSDVDPPKTAGSAEAQKPSQASPGTSFSLLHRARRRRALSFQGVTEC